MKARGWIFSTRLIPALLLGAGPLFHNVGPEEGPLPNDGNDVDCGISEDRCCVGELGLAFLEGCLEGLEGANGEKQGYNVNFISVTSRITHI